MGHIRLGTIPTTQTWRNVVAAVLSPDVVLPAAEGESGVRDTTESRAVGLGSGRTTFGDSETRSPDFDSTTVAEIAAKTLVAAEGALRSAKNDEGLRFTFYLLSQVALASRNADWIARLSAKGIYIDPADSLTELTVAFQSAIDARLEQRRASSDIAEIAQRAAGHALCELAADKAETLFGNSGEELRLALRALSSPQGFGRLSQAFFGSFLAQFLNFYLSRVTASQLGRGYVGQIGDISDFNRALSHHCTQSAAIVRDFAAEWYSKAEFQSGIDSRKVGGFLAIAIRKLQAELSVQARA